MSVYAVALDPGGTTGMAIVRDKEDPWAISVEQLEGNHHRELYRELHIMSPEYIICETFENRGLHPAILVSKEYIGVVKLYIQRTDALGVWQSASTGKAFWTDDKLKEHHLYVPGMRHARDAIRHYATWRTFTKRDRSLLEKKTTARIRSAVFPSRSPEGC